MTPTLTVSGLERIEQTVRELYLSVRLRADQPEPTFTVTQSTVGPLAVGRLLYDMTAQEALSARPSARDRARGARLRYATDVRRRRRGRAVVLLRA